ncbi:MAG TPA: hypothetical protein VGI87_01600 [Solirubrobacteraceae bacterium]|jgi:hypothetical protein
MVLSASKELEPDARAMLLGVEGLFRFDVQISGDTLRTIVRNLSSGAIEMAPLGGSRVANNVAYGEVTAYQPGSATLDFTLGDRADPVEVAIQVGTLHLADRGTIRVTAQAIVRQAPLA